VSDARPDALPLNLQTILRAAMFAAWEASKVGAISLATLFTAANIAFGAYYFASGHVSIWDLLTVPLGGAVVFALSLPFSFAITMPVSVSVGMCSYPFLRGLGAVNRRAFAIAGFLVGSLVWLGAWWNGPPGNLYFGFWISSFVIGGPAGCAGGLAFAQHLREGTAPPGNDGERPATC
jgi:hypothetical protein